MVSSHSFQIEQFKVFTTNWLTGTELYGIYFFLYFSTSLQIPSKHLVNDHAEYEKNKNEPRSEKSRIQNKTKKLKHITLRTDIHVQSHLNVCFEEQNETVV